MLSRVCFETQCGFLELTEAGLLECPCTTRTQKQWTTTYTTAVANQCSVPLFNATECFVAAPSLAPSRPQRARVVQDATLPPGCVVLTQNTTVEAVFNTISSNVSCGAGATQFWGQAQCNITGVTATLAMDVPSGRVTISLQGPAAVWLGVAFNATSMAQLPYAIIVDGNGAVTERTLGDHDAGTLLSPQVVYESATQLPDTSSILTPSLCARNICPIRWLMRGRLLLCPMLSPTGRGSLSCHGP